MNKKKNKILAFWILTLFLISVISIFTPVSALNDEFSADRTLTDPTDDTFAVTLSDDGEWCAAGGNHDSIYIYNISNNWALNHTINFGGDTKDVHFSHNLSSKCQYIAIANADEKVYVNYTVNWTSRVVLDNSTEPVNCIAFSDNNSYLAAGANGGRIYVWNTTTWENISYMKPSANNIYDLDWSNKNLFCGEATTGKVWVYNISDWTLNYTIDVANNHIRTVRVSPDNKYVMYGGHEPKLYINFTKNMTRFKEHADSGDNILGSDWSQDGEHYAIGSADNCIYVYNTSDWTLWDSLDEPTDDVRFIDFGYNNDYLVAGNVIDAGIIYVYNYLNGTLGPAEEEEYEASCTGYEYGNWSHSEHVIGGDLDESWWEENNSIWYINDSSSWWINNYTHTFNGTDSNHSFAVLNNSGLNRTQRFGWVHANDTEQDALWPYIIYAFQNETSFDCVMWSSNEVWTLHWNGTNFTDIQTGQVLEDSPSIDPGIQDISDQWVQEGVYLTDSGNYYKLIYNEINGTFYFKWWGPNVMSEPTGWAAQFTHINITHPHCSDGAQGYGVWNPNGRDAQVQFDLSQVWELNYTTNVSNWCNISGMNESRPHMNFPVLDMGEWTEEILSYFSDTFDGNLTWDNVTKMMKDNITNIMNMESRMMKFKTPSGNLQNDTVYYYSCVIDNFTAIDPESMFDEFLHIHVQMCPEYEIELDEYGDMIVAIDVDNNRQWDANDRLYWAWANDTYDEILFTFNGLGNIILNTAGVSIWQTVSNAPANLHRYGPHLQYALSIPLADLVNETGQPLNTSDVFGLSIITTTSGASTATEIPCVWQNWNETTELTFWDETLHMDEAMDYFFTSVGVEGLGANSTSIGRWGEGQIEGEFEASGEVSYEVNITKVSNVTSITDADWYFINYTIWVNNTGAGALTNLVVNDTNQSCSCGNFNGTIISSSEPWTNITNRTCFIEFTRAVLPAGVSWEIWYVVNVTNCSGFSQGIIFNNATVNATELDSYREDTHEVYWGLVTTNIIIHHCYDTFGDSLTTGEAVFAIIGIVMIIGAILAIIGVVRKSGVI